MQHPQRLGKYHITEVIGEGAMGVVYKAFDPGIQRVVALKTIRRQFSNDSDHASSAAARFRNEAQAAGRLLHPGIVTVYEYGEDGPVAFIAMEHVIGNSLAQYLSREVCFSDEDILSLFVQLLDALEHAHSLGVLHRDIKPANLLIARAGKVKVADFGIARIDDIGLTQVNASIGSPGYMAPEQFLGQPLDRRVDIHGAGALLYQLLTGRPAFTGNTEALMYKVVHEAPTPPSQVESYDRDVVYDAIVAKALAKDPAHRYASALEFRDALVSAVPVPVSPALSDKTIIMELLPRVGSTSTGGSGSISSPGPAAWTTAAPTHWDPSILSHVEVALAQHVGPLAKVIVRRAARECSNLTTLKQLLADHVTDPVARAAFTGAEPASSPTQGTAFAPDTEADTPSSPLNDAVINKAQQLLAEHVGPIAKVIVKNARAKAIDREQFFLMLVDSISASPERDKLLGELSQLS